MLHIFTYVFILCFAANHCGILSLYAFPSGPKPCTESEFPCLNGNCTHKDTWCDLEDDCSDSTDEYYCDLSDLPENETYACPPDFFRCFDDSMCIPDIGVCDGYVSCEDRSDERDCENSSLTTVDPNPIDHTESLRFQRLVSEPPETTTDTTTTTTDTTTDTTTTATTDTTTDTTTTTTDTSTDTTTTTTTDTTTITTQMTTLLEENFLNDDIEKMTQIPQQFNMKPEMYTELRPEYYSHQREMATRFLISQRKDDFGWGEETPRALMALLLSNASSNYEVPGAFILMIKQFDVQLSIALVRNETKPMHLTDLALYINAITTTCRDPRNFYGYDLVSNLRHRIDGIHRTINDQQFVSPSVFLTLCINNVTTDKDVEKLRNLFLSNSIHMNNVGIQALALLASTCIVNSPHDDLELQFRLRQKLMNEIKTEGLPKNVYEVSLLIQALNEAQVNELEWHRAEAINFLLKRQSSSGSFGDILATYYVLPILSGRSVLSLKEHCSHFNQSDLIPIEVLKNSKLEKINVKYSLYYGYPVDLSLTLRLHVARGTNFLDILRLAQERNPNYKFKIDDSSRDPLVYSIGGIPNDAERGMFWTLFYASNKTQIPGKKKRLRFYHKSIKMLIPEEDDEMVFWLKPLNVT